MVQTTQLVTQQVSHTFDGNPVLRFKPGQYLSIKLVHPALEHQEIRQYSLSDAPNGRDYRISVKREPRGQASNLLHDHLHIGDTVDIMPPAGDFFLQEVTDTPVVLISAGVGLTPMLSMLNHLLAEGPDMDIRWLHACEHGAHHAFRDEIRAKSRQHGKLESRIWYREPGEQDVKGEDYDFSGTLALEQVTDLIPADAHYYFCGPVPFMKAVKAQLENVGVPAERMHYEVFGPHQGL
jgi:nitric oxide dioxygenase